VSHLPPIRGKFTGGIPKTYKAPTGDKCLLATPDVGMWLHLNLLLRVNIPMLRIFFYGGMPHFLDKSYKGYKVF